MASGLDFESRAKQMLGKDKTFLDMKSLYDEDISDDDARRMAEQSGMKVYSDEEYKREYDRYKDSPYFDEWNKQATTLSETKDTAKFMLEQRMGEYAERFLHDASMKMMEDAYRAEQEANFNAGYAEGEIIGANSGA